jgi:hypothetical protein
VVYLPRERGKVSVRGTHTILDVVEATVGVAYNSGRETEVA